MTDQSTPPVSDRPAGPPSRPVPSAGGVDQPPGSGRPVGPPGRLPGGPVRLSRWSAVGLSVLSFGAAVGVGHLVAGLVGPLSSPYQAVADSVVRLAPAPLVDFGKTLVLPGLPAGRADKVSLLVGVGVVLLAVASLAGLASRSSARPGLRTLTVIGLIGLAAVCFSPVFALSDVAAPLAALGAGLWCFRWLHGQALALAAGPARLTSGPAAEGGVTRRGLLAGSAVVGLGAVGAGVGGTLLGAGTDVTSLPSDLASQLRPSSPAAPLPAGADFAAQGTPTFLTANQDFYRIDTALRLPVKTAADWSMRIHGLVDREMVLRYEDLLRRPLVQRPVTLTCVSNEVGGGLISTAEFVGVDLRALLVEAGVQRGADQLFSTSLDGWTAGTPVDVLLEPDRGAMLALGMNGEPLPLEHGFPVRMVVPGLYGYVSATKWLADLELTTFGAKEAYWLERGWAQRAPIKTQSRIDRPRFGDSVPAGRLTAAGIAWAQPRGVTGVEVRVDGGAWQPAQLAADVSRDTWRMWRVDLTVPPGPHLLQARAIDSTGEPQTDVPAPPVPDGASGYPEISFTATAR